MAEHSNPPSPDLLRELISYDPETGAMFWRSREPRHYDDGGHSAEHKCAIFNSRCAGRRADRPSRRDGYRTVSVAHRNFLAHRVAWAIAHGKWPGGQIDHINGNTGDNRIINLRSVDNTTNARNAVRVRARSASGFVGVYSARRGRWRVIIGGKHIGQFATFDEAVAARKAASEARGYSARHGGG